jgi:hypothetical protein
MLAGLDRLLAKKKNEQAMMAGLEKELLKDPATFFKTVVMPLLPREAKLSVENDGIVMWRNLLGQDVRAEDVGPAGKGLPAATPRLQENGGAGGPALP